GVGPAPGGAGLQVSTVTPATPRSLFENPVTVPATVVVPVFRTRQAPEVPSLVGNGGLRSCAAWAGPASPTLTANAPIATNAFIRTLLTPVVEHRAGCANPRPRPRAERGEGGAAPGESWRPSRTAPE